MLSTATSTKAFPISIHALRKESDNKSAKLDQ